MTITLARGSARSARHTTRHADQVEPPQTVTVGPDEAVRTTALTAEESQDGLILETVSDIENLTTGMSRKIWQKITLLSST